MTSAIVGDCEICGSARVAPWVTVTGYVYHRCRQCRHLSVRPRPSAAVIEAYYRDAAFYDKAISEEVRLAAEARVRVRELQHLAERFGLEHRLLDVGCATGVFLREARDARWSVSGIEPSPALAERARARGLTVSEGWLERVPASDRYPVVTAWEVIEHVLDPISFFRHLRARVRPGGLLALSTPLSTGLPALLLRSRFPMLSAPEHLSVFSRRSLALLATRLGFEVVAFKSFSNLKRDNLARGLCRLAFGRAAEPGTTTWRLAAALSSLLAPLPRVMDALGAGSEMQVVLRYRASMVDTAAR